MRVIPQIWSRFTRDADRLRRAALMISLGPLLTASIPHFAPSAVETPTKVPQILPLNDSDTGFRQIFDGKTLNGWDGDSAYWHAQGGAALAERRNKNLVAVALANKNARIVLGATRACARFPG